jgi:hypothetical protein
LEVFSRGKQSFQGRNTLSTYNDGVIRILIGYDKNIPFLSVQIE